MRLLNPKCVYVRCGAHFLSLAIIWALHLSVIYMKSDFVSKTVDMGGKNVTVVLPPDEAKEAKKMRKAKMATPGLSFHSKSSINKSCLISRVRKFVVVVKKSNLIHFEFERMPKIAETAAHQVNGSIGHKELPSLKNFADTRWCGIYDMLSSFVPNKDVFALLRKSGVSGKLEKLPEFTEEDFSVMGDLISILEPISHAITSLESDCAESQKRSLFYSE